MQVTDFSPYACTWGAEPPTVQEIVDVARHAEDLGFHSLQIPHVPVLPYPEERPPRGGIAGFIPNRYRQYQYDPLVLLPMLAQATSRIRIGFNVAVTPYLHPYVWAKYLASLDAATGGRVIAGFGLGYGPPQGIVPSLESVGIDGRQRGKMADEALELITKLWTADAPLDFEGRYYRLTRLTVDPKPASKPYPELWWAGDAVPSIERAARYADYLEVMWPPAREIQNRFVPALREANARMGGRAKVSDMIFAEVHSTDPSRETIGSRYHIGWKEDAFAVGTPETVAGTIRKLHAAGVEHFALDMHRHGWDHVRVLHGHMDAFVKQVLPLLR